MDKAALIDRLNQAIALELCAAIQYNQYSNVLMGADRRIWHELFEDMSKGGLADAHKFGFRVVALGGVPTIEHTPVRQASNIGEMLQYAMEHEQALVRAYNEALEVAKDNAAYRNLLEDQIEHEHHEAEELSLFLNKVERAAAAPKSHRAQKTA